MGHQQSRGPTVFGRQWLARPVERDEVLGPVEVRQGQVGRESLFGNDETVLRLLLKSRPPQQVLDRHAFEIVVEPAPRRNAMDVAVDGPAGQGEKFVPRQRERPFDHAGNRECPLRRVDAGYVAVMQDRPFGSLDLAGRDSWIPHAQAWARFDTALKRSASLGPFFRMGLAPKALSNPLTTAAALSPHNVSRFPSCVSRSTDVISTPSIPQGTMRSKCVRSLVTLP